MTGYIKSLLETTMYISVEPKLGGPSYYTTSYGLGSYAVLLKTSSKIVYDDATRAAHVKLWRRGDWL